MAADSAGQFNDPLVTRPAADRERAVNDISGSGFQTAAEDARRQSAASGETGFLGADQDQGTSAGRAAAARRRGVGGLK